MSIQLENPDPAAVPGNALAKRELASARQEVDELGGWRAFKDGRFLFPLIQKSFKSYYDRADAGQFRAAHPGQTDAQIADQLITEAARFAAAYGVATGAVISADEIVALLTGGEGVIGIPANLAIAVAAVCAEAICLIRVHLQLIASLAKLTGQPLNADDPDDILIILAYAFGGSAAEAAGKLGMKIGHASSKTVLTKIIGKESAKSLASKVGAKLLRRSILKYTLPLVSMAIGGGWNYAATRSVGKIALKHMTTKLLKEVN